MGFADNDSVVGGIDLGAKRTTLGKKMENGSITYGNSNHDDDGV